jgi:SAM-dependent methyltransferase
MLLPEQDPMGQAMLDYLRFPDDKANITVLCDVADDDVIPVKLLFRRWDEMNVLERLAIENCFGRVLDLGAGSGCHALELQKIGVEVVAADISPGAVEVMKARGVLDARGADLAGLGDEKFDSILMMMNGIGITGNLKGLADWLKLAKQFLSPGGHIIFDTSDIEYIYMETDGSICIPMDRDYYGEVRYQMKYKDIKGAGFPWLFIDSVTLTNVAYECGYDIELLDAGENFTYLVRLSLL